MDAFVLECLQSTGWKRSGDAYWTLDAAKAKAVRLIAKRQAQRVRILPVEVNLNAVAEFPQQPGKPARESEAAPC